MEVRKDIFGVQKFIMNVIYIAKAGIRLKGIRKGCFWGNYFTCWVSILPFWALFGERVFLCGNQWGWVIYGTSWLNRREKLVSVIKLDIILGNIRNNWFLFAVWHHFEGNDKLRYLSHVAFIGSLGISTHLEIWQNTISFCWYLIYFYPLIL